MAFLDVTDVLRDPDFTDLITIISREDSINEYGEMVLEYSEGVEDYAVVEGVDKKTLDMLPDSARLRNPIVVFYNGVLNLETDTTYADIVVWNGKRYQVYLILEDFGNFGDGFVKAVCLQVDASV